MQLSIFLAQILSLLYLAVGLGLIISKSHYKKVISDMLDNAAVVYIGGIIALIFGFLIVMSHNIWIVHWAVLITVIGWLALIKGALLLVLPGPMLRLTRSLAQKKNFLPIEGVIVLILGLVLGYYGFIS